MPGAAWIQQNQNRAAPFVDLDWNNNTEPDLIGYNAYRSANGTDYTKLNTSLILVSSFRDKTPLNPATTNYYYKVTAVDTNGNESAYSSVVQTMGGAPQRIRLVGMVGVRGAA